MGTNASGKSSLGVTLAKTFDGEIVSADSRQIYRGLDIGTGKLSADEMSGVPHHLIDVADVSEQFFSLAEYQEMAYRAIDDIVVRHRPPFMVGGTGLYVRAIVEGYRFEAAPPDYERRRQLEAMEPAELWSTLAGYDAPVAGRFDPRNKRRIIRAIEIIEHRGSYPEEIRNEPRFEFLQLGLTWPPDVLRERIEKRLALRLDEGMVDEARRLMDRGVTPEIMESLGLEYRHLAKLILGGYQDESEFFENLSRAIYRFSRRQMSWFTKQSAIVWLDTSGDYVAEATERVAAFLDRDSPQSR
ncbi:tRNA dimethylallyltransferase 2 [Rugosimonospora africana]|uniref:tRNA dimethylallyltransferase n=2 Tax=Rugosimonospora africana TaxID=556532 RepID=A0A8J3QZT7_9ACTN|nr:tRNA dimethylallyltransferase 2 [Rugosimonospora africana]